jgi:outer membrane protein, heavy metal efflux system
MGLFLLLVVGSTTNAAEPIREEPAGSLTLTQVMALVSERSPVLAADAWSVRAAEERKRYAGSISNPEVTALVEDALGTGDFSGFDRSQATLEVGQVIELGGKRGARRAVAEGEEDVARRDYEHRRVEVAGNATIAFIHVVADQHRVALAKKARELAAAAAEAAERRVQSGATSTVEEQRARILLARSIIDEESAAHELASARRRLAAAWGSAEPRFTEAKADLFSRAPAPAFEELAARIDRNPEMRRLAGERARRTAALDLARARAVPDVRTFAGVRRLEGVDETAFLGGVSLMLPVFDRNRGAVGEARALRSQIEDETAAVKVELLATLFAEYQELAHVTTALDSLEKDVIPRAEKMLEAIDEGFRLGRFTQLELVDAQRTLVEVRNEHIDATEEYHVFVARLEMMLGEPLRGPSPRGQE